MNDVSPTVFLHVGTPKSGTTMVQRLINNNQESLSEQGVHWAGGAWRKQVRAVRGLQGLAKGEFPGHGDVLAQVLGGMRDAQTRAALMSMEWLGGCRPHQVGVVLSGVDPSPVELVITARDLVRTSPSAWQENVQNRRTMTWDEWCDGLFRRRAPAYARRFWDSQWLPGLITRWVQGGTGRVRKVHLVTVPPAGSDPRLLWSRFCDVIGVDGESWQARSTGNPSIGLSGAELMRRVNLIADEQDLDHAGYEQVVKNLVAKTLVPRHSRGKPVLPGKDAKQLAQASEAMVEQLREVPGLEVHGSLDDLVGVEPNDPPSSGVSDAELLDLTLRVLVDLADRDVLADAAKRLDRARR